MSLLALVVVLKIWMVGVSKPDFARVVFPIETSSRFRAQVDFLLLGSKTELSRSSVKGAGEPSNNNCRYCNDRGAPSIEKRPDLSQRDKDNIVRGAIFCCGVFGLLAYFAFRPGKDKHKNGKHCDD